MSEPSCLKSRTIVALLVCVAVCGLSPAAQGQAAFCGLEGSWLTSVDDLGSPIRILDVLNRGANGTSGTISGDWVLFDATLGGFFPNAERATSAIGSYQRLTAVSAVYSWRAYGLDENGDVVYVVRTSGLGHLPNCDRLDFDYTLEIFLPHQDLETEDPIAVLSGTGHKDRIPLTCTGCE